MSAVSNDFPPLTTENVESFIKNMMNALVLSTKTSNSIPSGSDFEYFSNFGEFRLGMGELSSTVADHIQQICQAVQHSSDDVSAPPEDLSDAALYDLVVDMIDSLLESADSMMEKSLGGGDNLSSSVRDTLISDQGRIFSETKDMPKPQLKFLEDIDNSRRRPFRPHVPDKPHAVVPLDMNEQPVERDSEEDLSVIGPSTYFPHPYTREIQGVPSRAQYQSQIADAGFVGPELPSAGQPFELVETLEALERMAEELDGVKEVGVDLEHHHHRTYQGLTCLMQLSCRDKDYIVDVLALRQHMHILLPLFTDSDVVKVFHGCEKDVIWLQRDLGLYVVNCFDTFHAAKALSYPALSLAHLLKFYCGVTLNKKYQLADWRERPLPTHLIEYAKLDTHYLLYVYDCLRRDVHASHGSSGVEAVHDASRRTTLQRYEKPSFYPLGYLKLINPRTSPDRREATEGNGLTFEQNSVLSCLWNWRDLTARREDESCGYIMSNAELLRIGKAVPSDTQAIIATGPLGEFTREHLEDICSVIQEQLQGGGNQGDRMPMASAGEEAGGGEEESFMLNLSSPAPANKKRSSFEVGMGGTRHQMGRMQGYSTVTEFTPHLSAIPSVSSFHPPEGSDQLLRNDGIGTDPDWKKKLFEEAKWNYHPSQPNATPRVVVEASLDPALSGGGIATDSTAALTLGKSMATRMEKSEDELKQFSLFHEGRGVSVFAAPVDAAVTEKPLHNPPVASSGGDDVEMLDALPKSLTDIYNLSNRNRWLNKDKKRNRDATTSDTSSGVGASALEVSESSQSGDWYHVDKDKERAIRDHSSETVEGTLDIAASVGWLGDAVTREAVKAKHAMNESNSNSNTAQQETHLTATGSDGPGAGLSDNKKPGVKNGTSRQTSHHKDKGYDYSRVTSSNSALGVMSTVNTGTTDRDSGKYNPFLSSSVGTGGNGGYSNAANRSNNNNASKPRKQQGTGKSKHSVTIERRDTNRSQIFSAPANK